MGGIQLPPDSRHDILRKLEQRRKKAPEIRKEHASRIQYQADLRRSMELENMRAEQMRLRNILGAGGQHNVWLARQRFEEISKDLAG